MGKYTKYPRTFHLPMSEGATSDDKVLKSTQHLRGKEVVITKKMDGETSTLYRDYRHARSIDSPHHASRDWLANMHFQIAYNIPEWMRICGENLYATHSIRYTDLESYFYGFSVWDNDTNVCLDWDETVWWFAQLGITPVEVVWRGVYSDEAVMEQYRKLDLDADEGLVVRLVESFDYDDFQWSVAKMVRPNHVTSDEHWMHSTMIRNGLISQ